MAELVFQLAFGVIALTYLVATIILIYHIFAFGINRRTAIVSVIAYILGSIFLFALLLSNLQSILQFT